MITSPCRAGTKVETDVREFSQDLKRNAAALRHSVTECDKEATESTADKEATTITTAGKAHCQALQYGLCGCKHGCYLSNGECTVVRAYRGHSGPDFQFSAVDVPVQILVLYYPPG